MSSGNLMRLKVIKDYLKTKFIIVPDQWILSQINGNDSNQENIYRSWLNSDLSRIPNENHVLPSDINTIKTDDNKQTAVKTTIYGKYALQINSIRDISKPKVLSAADALDDDENGSEGNSDESDTENNRNMFKRKKLKVEKKPKKKGPRMLSMILTDGSIECKAIEYQPIDALSADTPIGTKLVISGPFDVYAAVMFLTSRHVTVLGGSIPVETQTPNRDNDVLHPL